MSLFIPTRAILVSPPGQTAFDCTKGTAPGIQVACRAWFLLLSQHWCILSDLVPFTSHAILSLSHVIIIEIASSHPSEKIDGM